MGALFSAWGVPGAALAQEGESLPTIVVTGTRSGKTGGRDAGAHRVVTRQEIERTHARTLKDALENVPGLQLREIHGKSGYEVSLQGHDQRPVLVLIDGLPITASTGSTVDVSQYLLTEVDRIEVVKGASSAQYGSSAMGGVINVITRPIARGFSGAASADTGSYGAQNASGTPGALHGNARVEAAAHAARAPRRRCPRQQRLCGRPGRLDPARRRGAPPAVRRPPEWLPGAAGSLWLDASAYRENDEQRYRYYAPPRYVPQSKSEDISRKRFAAGAQWRFGNGVQARAAGMTEGYDSTTQEYSNDYRTATRASSQRTDHLSLQFDMPAWRSQLWQFGGDLHRERTEQTANNISELRGKAERSSAELYAQNDIFFNDTGRWWWACAASATRTSAATSRPRWACAPTCLTARPEGRAARQLRPATACPT